MQAFRKNRFYPKYIYLTFQADMSNWRTDGPSNFSATCSSKERAQVLHNSIAVTDFKFQDEPNDNISWNEPGGSDGVGC